MIVAARRPGGSATASEAGDIAKQLLRKTPIADEVARYQARILKRLEISAEKVLDYQARSAFFDPRELVDERGQPKRLQDLPEHVATALTSVELDEKGRVVKTRWDRSARRQRSWQN